MTKNKKATTAKSVVVKTPVVNPTPAAESVQETQPEGNVKLLIVQPARQLTVVKSTRATAEEVTPIPAEILEECKAAKLNIVNTIKSLYATGYSYKQIIAAGYQPSTVYRQIGEYKKSLIAVATEKTEAGAGIADNIPEANLEAALIEGSLDTGND